MSPTSTTTSPPKDEITTSITSTISVPVLAAFNYYAPPPDGPGAPSPNDLALILGTKDQDTRLLPVRDARGHESRFSLRTNGFRYVTRPSSLDAFRGDFSNDDLITGTYYAEVEALLRLQFPDNTITTFHHLGHIIRSAPKRTDFSPEAETPTDPAWNKPDRGAAPAPRVHVDFTREGVRLVLIQAVGSEITELVTDTGKRYVAFSVWRPLKQVRRDPLGICDAQSVKAGELVKLRRLYPDGKEGENVVVKATEDGKEGEGDCGHEWWWMREQTPEEVLIIKIFDSTDEDPWEDGVVRVGPHCSFHVDGTEEEAIRESIEVRVVACFG